MGEQQRSRLEALRWAAAGAARYVRLIADLLLLRGRIRNPILICLSVDFDLRYKENPLRGYEILEALFARFGLTGRVTYLLNPYYWLGDESPVYAEMVGRGGEIGLHTHAEELVHRGGPELEALIGAQKALIEGAFRRFDPAFRVRSFRSGSRVTSPDLFRALAAHGIPYDSSLAHFERRRRIFDFTVDDSGTPDRAYYLDPESPKAEAGGPQAIVELPVTHQIPALRRLARALRPGEPLVVSTYVHPFNVHRSGKPARAFILFYAFVLFCLTRMIPGARFEHLSAAGAAWEVWYRRSSGAEGGTGPA